MFDDFDDLLGTGFEANTTPWQNLSQDKFIAKMGQLEKDAQLVKEGLVKRVVWFGTEQLPESGLGGTFL